MCPNVIIWSLSVGFIPDKRVRFPFVFNFRALERESRVLTVNYTKTPTQYAMPPIDEDENDVGITCEKDGWEEGGFFSSFQL